MMFESCAADGLPYKGIALQIQRVTGSTNTKNRSMKSRVGAIRAVVVDARQENGSSSRIYLDIG